jgi:hypothetical protein
LRDDLAGPLDDIESPHRVDFVMKQGRVFRSAGARRESEKTLIYFEIERYRMAIGLVGTTDDRHQLRMEGKRVVASRIAVVNLRSSFRLLYP